MAFVPLSTAFRRQLYPIALIAVLLGWCTAMAVFGKWHVLADYWQMSVTMVFGSFVAGSTPAGGGSVAFPVFTKLLQIDMGSARTFSLIIQSVGMGMAGIFIWSKRIRVYGAILMVAIPAGCIGHAIGTFWVALPAPLPRLLFTMVALVFAFSLFVSHWLLRWHPAPLEAAFRLSSLGQRLHVAIIAAIGGWVASAVGSGIDILLFAVMALGFGLHEKRAIPTSVIAMASISVFGSLLRIMNGSIAPATVDHWLACVPIVAVGAPLGAFVAARIGRDLLIGGLITLALFDFTTTVILIPIEATGVMLMLITGLAAFAYLCTQLCRRASRRQSEESSG